MRIYSVIFALTLAIATYTIFNFVGSATSDAIAKITDSRNAQLELIFKK